MTSPYRLFGVECSYYAAKIRACLAYKRVPFVEEQASRRVYAEEILPRVGWPVVPVLVTPDDRTVQDTSDMVDLLEARHPLPAVLPADGAARVLSYLLEFLGDEWLKLPAMHYRWNHNYDFIVAEFGRNNDPEASPAEQWRVGEKVAPRFRDWLEPLGVVPASEATVEQDYLALLDLLDAHFAEHPYLLGGAPTLGDFAFFGPLYAHLERDPNSGAIMHARAPRVADWVARLRAGAEDAEPGAALQAPPASLLPVLRLLNRDFVPMLTAETAALQAWLAEQSGTDELPRHVGRQRLRLGRDTPREVEVERALFPYDLFMLQRVQDAFHALPEDQARSARDALAACGADALLDLRLARRVTRRDFRLVRA
ncbi:MAG: glutathione S-transferase family protein [Gammaproteobacteria bacterium]